MAKNKEKIMNLDGEEWKSVGTVKGVDFTGQYEVSNKGRLKSCERNICCKNGTIVHHKEHLMSLCLSTGGYPSTVLRKNGQTRTILVHIIEMQAFKPNPNPDIYTDVNHIDEDKTNNNLNNLEWCTRKYNVNFGTRTERATKTKKEQFIPIVQLDFNGDIINVYYKSEDLKDDYYISKRINKGRNICYGYFWMRLDKYNDLSQSELLSLIKELRKTCCAREWEVVAIDENGTLVYRFDNITQAVKELNCQIGSISNCIHGFSKSCCGLKWMYLCDYEKLNK